MTVRFNRYFDDSTMDAIEKYRIKDLVAAIKELSPDCKNSQYDFDLHIREKSELMVYHGGTCLLTINFKHLHKGEINFSSKSYGGQGEKQRSEGCSESFKNLKGDSSVEDISKLSENVCAFLREAVKTVADKYYNEESEGFLSSRLSIDYGRNWEPLNDCDWLIIDRESVLGFDNKDDKDEFDKDINDEVVKAKSKLPNDDSWTRICKSFGNELDFLAINKKKQLVCIELKKVSNGDGICWGPLQATVYQQAFTKALSNISSKILTLAQQKIKLGLLPEAASSWLPEEGFKSVLGVLAVAGSEKPASPTYWDRARILNDSLKSPLKLWKAVQEDNKLIWEDVTCK